MPKNKDLEKVKRALDPENPKKIEDKSKSRKVNNSGKNMLFIFSFFKLKNLSAKTVVSYILTFGIFICACIFTLAADAFDVRRYITVIIVWLFCIVAVFVVLPFVPYGISTGRKDIKLFMIGRYIGNIFIVFMMNTSVSFGICFAVVGVLGGILFVGDQNFASLVIKSILYIIFILVMYTLTSYHGRTDTEKKVFNPHMTFQSVILANAFLLPTTRINWFYYNELGKDLYYDAQTFLSELEVFRNLGETGFIIGIIIIFLINCYFALFFYNMGRNAFFKKHPEQLLYDSVEINSLMYSKGTADFRDVM